MIALTTSAMLQVAILTIGAQNGYADAHKAATQKGEPLLVLVGASWCPACMQMKSTVVPELARRGDLKPYHFAQVDIDQQHDLAGRLSSAGVIPQLILYRKTADGWRRWEVTGGQSPEEVEEFLHSSRIEQATHATSTVSQR